MTCFTCRHFHRRHTDPRNLAAPAVGQCREQLHVIVIPTRDGYAEKTLYPLVPADFAACSRHAARPEVTQ